MVMLICCRDAGDLNADFSFSHFTQVIWKSTTKLGCGVAKCDNMFPDHDGPATYHVCLYDPVGNVIGQEEYVYHVPWMFSYTL